jgi:predicted metal-binding protein
MKKIVVVHPRRAPPVFVCRKCLKRSDDAKGIAHALKSETKRSASGRERPTRVIKTSCFGICPKRAVVVTGGAAAGSGDYVLISSGAEVAAALERLQDDTTER